MCPLTPENWLRLFLTGDAEAEGNDGHRPQRCRCLLVRERKKKSFWCMFEVVQESRPLCKWINCTTRPSTLEGGITLRNVALSTPCTPTVHLSHPGLDYDIKKLIETTLTLFSILFPDFVKKKLNSIKYN